MRNYLLLIILFVSACKQEYPSAPSDVIQQQQMKLILMDMHMADAVAETKAQNGASEVQLTQQYNQQIFKLHNVTREQFVKSYHFYETNPKLLNKMYEEILVEMSKREAELSKPDFNHKKN